VFWIRLLLPVAIDVIMKYIRSTDTKRDDEILKIVEVGAGYISAKNDDDLNSKIAKVIRKIEKQGNKK